MLRSMFMIIFMLLETLYNFILALVATIDTWRLIEISLPHMLSNPMRSSKHQGSSMSQMNNYGVYSFTSAMAYMSMTFTLMSIFSSQEKCSCHGLTKLHPLTFSELLNFERAAALKI
jgi:hypothetical protein